MSVGEVFDGMLYDGYFMNTNSQKRAFEIFHNYNKNNSFELVAELVVKHESFPSNYIIDKTT